MGEVYGILHAMRKLRESLGQHRIVGGALVLAVTQFGASLMGLLRDRLLAQTFPALEVVDVYIASFRPSDLLFQLSISAGFVALVPLLARYRAEGDTKEMSRLLSSVIVLSAFSFGALALILALLFPWIAPLLTQFQGSSLVLYTDFGRLALLTNLPFVFGAAFGQYLTTIQRYWVFGLTPILYTLGTILGTVFLTPIVGPYGPILGTVGGTVVYALLRFLAVSREGFHPTWMLWHPDLSQFGWMMVPRIIALGALQLELLLFDTLASGLGSGAVTINAYARNFQSVVIGVIGIALAQSAFSPLSQAAAKGDRGRFWLTLQKGVLVLIALTIPAAIALIALAPLAAWLVNLNRVLPLFSVSLALYAVSIPFESLNHLLLRSFYALKDTVVPAIVGVLNGTIAIALSWSLTPRFGVWALALGFTVGQVIQMLGLVWALPRKVRRI